MIVAFYLSHGPFFLLPSLPYFFCLALLCYFKYLLWLKPTIFEPMVEAFCFKLEIMNNLLILIAALPSLLAFIS